MMRTLKLFSLLFKRFGGFLAVFKKFLPITFSLIIISISLLGSISESLHERDPTIFLKEFATRVVAIDYNLYEIVEDYTNTGTITIFSFLEIFSNIYIMLFVYIKLIFKYVSSWGGRGGSTNGEAIFIAVPIFLIIEWAGIGMLYGNYRFIPWKGFGLVLWNMPMMIQNLRLTNIGIVKSMEPFLNATVDPEVMKMI